jgi:hypothetical protein
MTMKLKKALQDVMKVVIEEANRNPEFARQLETALGLEPKPDKEDAGRGAHRRAAAILDPISLAREGEDVLRSKLEPLTLDQLKDIVAEYGMDPGKLVMKWKTPDRVIDRIVEYSVARAKKGEAFLR